MLKILFYACKKWYGRIKEEYEDENLQSMQQRDDWVRSYMQEMSDYPAKRTPEDKSFEEESTDFEEIFTQERETRKQY